MNLKPINTDMTPQAQAIADQSAQIGTGPLLKKGFELVFAMGVQHGALQAMESLTAAKP